MKIIRLFPDKILKKLQVVARPQNREYAPSIYIQGKYLNNYDFKLGDSVFIEVSRGRIVIEKDYTNKKIRRA